MKYSLFCLTLVLVFAVGCSSAEIQPVLQKPTIEAVDGQHDLEVDELDTSGLLDREVETLNSLELVDPYPLYVMEYSGSYRQADRGGEILAGAILNGLLEETWACTLFTALSDAENRLYGRNFDWNYSPALLLFTDPPGKYASVSVVDLAYFGFSEEDVTRLHELPLSERSALLDAPWWPFDGMNDQGLAIGMAAVPSGYMEIDPDKETIDSLAIMREVLDTAKNVDEAVEIFWQYNIDMGGGPDLHYLISDRSGQAALIEFHQGEMKIIWNENPWHTATNFLCSAVEGNLEGHCWRYDTVSDRLEAFGGSLPTNDAISLLDNVAQVNTQWSVVYGMSTGEVNIAVGKSYENVYTFLLNQVGD